MPPPLVQGFYRRHADGIFVGNHMIIAVDFDGTCVDHRYPDVGPDLPDAVFTLQRLTKHGHKLILWTMRSGKELSDAVAWFDKNQIPLYGVQRNPDQDSWTTSPKAYAKVYIDDAAFGAPLVELAWMKRPGIDWSKVRAFFHVSDADLTLDEIMATIEAPENASVIHHNLLEAASHWRRGINERRGI